jgi:ATP/maltotriose-dependent transcriptional regulator MalT
MRTAFRRAGLSDAADALEPAGGTSDDLLDRLLGVLAASDDPMLVALDEIGNVSGAAASLVTRLGDELPGACELLLVGRSLPPALEPLASEPSVVRLGQAELAFTADETGTVLERAGAAASPGWAARVRRVTEGWPIAVQLVAERLTHADDAEAELERLESTPTVLAGLVGGSLEALPALPAEARAAVVQLAHLPELTTSIADRATGVEGIVGLAVGSGLPILVRAGGRVELADRATSLPAQPMHTSSEGRERRRSACSSRLATPTARLRRRRRSRRRR